MQVSRSRSGGINHGEGRSLTSPPSRSWIPWCGSATRALWHPFFLALRCLIGTRLVRQPHASGVSRIPVVWGWFFQGGLDSSRILAPACAGLPAWGGSARGAGLRPSAEPRGVPVLGGVRSPPFHPRKELGGKPGRSRGARVFGTSGVCSPPVFI